MSPRKKQQQPCRPITIDEEIAYTPSFPWFLESSTHGESPPLLGSQYFCKCMWEQIAPAPFVVCCLPSSFTPTAPFAHTAPQVDPVTFEYKPVWTPRADNALSIIWFHARLHTESHGSWTSNHYHEALSILLGHRISQHDFFNRVKYMRNALPQCWIEASMASSTSTAVTEVFKELNAKWEVFFGSFELWDGIVGDYEKAKKGLVPFLQWDRVVELSADVDKVLTRKEDLPEYFDGWLKWWVKR
jgi:hypothetical protein